MRSPNDADPPDEGGYCPACGLIEDAMVRPCECPECPICASVGDPDCFGNHIPDPLPIADLGRLYTAIIGTQDKGATSATMADRIGRMLFKSTNCGISFLAGPEAVNVAGYAEGSDAELPNHRLDFPFTMPDFWAAVKIADEEGEEAWHDANCERCNPPEGY